MIGLRYCFTSWIDGLAMSMMKTLGAMVVPFLVPLVYHRLWRPANGFVNTRGRKVTAAKKWWVTKDGRMLGNLCKYTKDGLSRAEAVSPEREELLLYDPSVSSTF